MCCWVTRTVTDIKRTAKKGFGTEFLPNIKNGIELFFRIYGLSWISLYFGPFRAAVFGGSAAVLILISLKVIGVDDLETPNSSSTDIQESELIEFFQYKVEDILF